jgi:WS/DGAT/MGAT family acyltransferase
MKQTIGGARLAPGIKQIEARLIRWAWSTFRPVADRASASDLAFLAMDTGPVPGQIAAIVVLDPDPAFDLAQAERLIAERVPVIPRLRQRLVRVPPGCGRPIWLDDSDFDIRRHIRRVRCRDPGDEAALLDTAVGVVVEALPRSWPLWSVVFITGVHGDRVALVVVLHHVLADGIGGLAVLGSLLEDVPSPPAGGFPRRRPRVGRLTADAFLERLRAVSRAPSAWRNLRTSMVAAGGLAPARAAPCSLVQRTGPRRRLGVVRADLAALRAAAHRHGGTVNDAVLTAVAGALHRVLKDRGESVDTLAVAVPVAGRRSTTTSQLGNLVAPLLVTVPATGDPAQRLRQVAAAVRAGKAAATGPPPISVLGPVFRAAAALGGYHWYMNRQHRLHTLVSHVRGPEQAATFASARVAQVIPVAVAEAGNLTVSFEVFSYAGTLTITAVVDPDHFPDLPVLTDGLQAELAMLVHVRSGLGPESARV